MDMLTTMPLCIHLDSESTGFHFLIINPGVEEIVALEDTEC